MTATAPSSEGPLCLLFSPESTRPPQELGSGAFPRSPSCARRPAGQRRWKEPALQAGVQTPTSLCRSLIPPAGGRGPGLARAAGPGSAYVQLLVRGCWGGWRKPPRKRWHHEPPDQLLTSASRSLSLEALWPHWTGRTPKADFGCSPLQTGPRLAPGGGLAHHPWEVFRLDETELNLNKLN